MATGEALQQALQSAPALRRRVRKLAARARAVQALCRSFYSMVTFHVGHLDVSAWNAAPNDLRQHENSGSTECDREGEHQPVDVAATPI